MRSEIEVLKRVRHPNIIGLIDIFESQSQVFLVCDLATGGELFEQIIAKGYYTEKNAAQLVKQILEGVNYLHSIDIVHRDLKPENLLFKDSTPNSPLMITDFGLSKVAHDDLGLHTSCGTPVYVGKTFCFYWIDGDFLLTLSLFIVEYIAPEIIQKKGHGKPVDMWAIGVS